MKIWEKINTITGNDSKSRNLVEYINAGSRFLLASLPEKFLWSISSTVDVSGWETSAGSSASISEGSAIAFDKILAVYREDGSDSNGNVKKRIAKEVQDDEIHSFDDSSSLLAPTSMFPKFYKLAGKIYIKPMPDYNASSSNQTYTKVGASSTTTVNATSGNKGVIVYAVAPVIDENTDNWILAEYENVTLYYACSLDSLNIASSYRKNALSSLTTITNSTTGNLAKFRNLISSYITPDAPVSLSINWDDLLSELPTFSFSETLSDFDVNSVLPSIEDLSITKTVSDFTTTVDLPTFTTPNIAIDLSNIDDALSKAQGLIDSTDVATNAQEWLEDEDNEMSAATVQVASQELQRANGAVGRERLKLEEFGASVSKEKTKFDSTLNNYQNEVNKESAKISSQVSALQSEIAQKTKIFEDKMAKFGADVQKASAKSGADIGKFNALLQKEQLRYQSDLAKFSAKIQEQSGEFQAKVQKHQSDIGEYSAKINSNAQDFQNKLMEAKTYLEEAGTNFQVADKYSIRASEEMSKSQLFYERAVNELQAITGASVAPPQQQQAQRQEQGKTT